MNESVELFQSFNDLQAAHDGLLERYEQLGDSADGSHEFWTEVEAFLDRAQATGALLHESSDRLERRASQSILDFWANTLYRVDRPLPDIRLLRFDKELAPGLPDEPCPYQGLSAFDEDRHEFFFGRERLVDQMVEKLGSGKRLLIVLGASGSGKSSVVRAGLLQVLKAGALPGSEDWRYAAMVPGANAIRNLERALQRPDRESGGPEPAPADDSPSGAEGGELVHDHPAGVLDDTSDRPIVLVVDQFEELFTLCDDEGVYKEFEDQLVGLVEEPQLPNVVVLTMRTDFEDKLALLPELHRRLEEVRVNVGALGLEELREAIEMPAAKVGLKFDAGIVDDLIAKILGVGAGLPLLQFTLLQLWEERDRNRVTEDVYRDVGDPLVALGRSADRFMGKLISEDWDTARYIFLQMVRTEDREPTGRRIALEEVFRRGGAWDRVERVVWRLVCEARLVKLTGTTTDICGDGSGYREGALHALMEEERSRGSVVQIEVAHEALVRNWDTLKQWLEEKREQLTTRRRLDTKAAEWVRLGRGSSGLLDEVELREVQRWLESPEAVEVGFDPELGALAETSRAAIEAAQREKEAARQREMKQLRDLAAEASARERIETLRAQEQTEAAKRERRRVRQLLVVGAVAVLFFIVASIFAVAAFRNAAKAARSTTSLRLAAAAIRNLDIDPELGLLLALYAVDETYSVDGIIVAEAEDALHRVVQEPWPELILEGNSGAVNDVAFNEDGKLLATASADGTAIVWDAISGTSVVTLTGHTAAVNGVAFSPDGTHLATAGADKTARVWDAISGTRELTLSGHTGAVNGVAFNEDGTRLATASADGTAIVWNAISGTKVLTLTGHTDVVNAVAFSPDGTCLATGSDDKTAKVWDVETGDEKRTLTGHTGAVNGVAFSPDGTRLATASRDRTARVWDAETGRELLSLTGHRSYVNDVAFSLDGTRLATTSDDKKAIVWNAETGEQMLTLTGHEGFVHSIAFGPDGMGPATASADGTAIVWDTTPDDVLFAPLSHELWVTGVAFSPDGKLLATASADKAAIVWDAVSGTSVLTLTGHTGAVNGVTFSPDLDDRRLATASADKTARVWDAEGGGEIHILTGHLDVVHAVAFSPDGKLLATASGDATAKLWDSVTGELSSTFFGHSGAVYGVAFSPDGKHLATASADGTAKLWDAVTGELSFTFGGHSGAVYSVAFSQDGKRLATASADKTAIVWDAVSGTRKLTLTGHTGAVRDVTFSPDGTRLVTGGADLMTKVWDATLGLELYSLSGHTAAIREAALSPDVTRLATASADSTVRVCTLDIEELKERACDRVTRSLQSDECQKYLREETCPASPCPDAEPSVNADR